MRRNQNILLTVSGALVALTVFFGWFVERSNFPALLGAYALFFALYLYVLLYRQWTQRQQVLFIGLGIALRAILLFSLPNLSDDFYRFLWDGRLAAQGIHPFAHPPSYFIENHLNLPGITPELYGKLNSPEYYTVYPPVCQAVFWLAAKMFPESINGGVFILKLFLLGCEAGTIWMLGRGIIPGFSNLRGIAINLRPRRGQTFVELKFGKIARASERPNVCAIFNVLCTKTKKVRPLRGFKLMAVGLSRSAAADGGGVGPALAYALNPLVLIEIMGNCHFEGAMLCFLLAGIFALSSGRTAIAAIAWALAAASKLVPLLFLPVVLVWLGWRRGFRFLLIFSAVCLFLFLPLLDLQVLRNMAGSLNLYFRQFEFNASIYYLLKTTGTAIAPPKMDVARTLGPVLAGVVIIGIAVLALYKRPGAEGQGRGYYLPDRMLFALMLYLALATTVHPWYVAPLFGLSLLTRYTFPLAWTAVAVLSYSHYAGGGYQEHFGWIGLEYLVVFGTLILNRFNGLRV